LAAAENEITSQEIQHLTAQQIPNAVLQTFDGVGHNMKVEMAPTVPGRYRIWEETAIR